MNLGFVGVGAMGAAMARHLIAAGHTLSIHDRVREKAAPFEALGARMATSPADAARGAEVVLTMLEDDRAAEEAILGPTGVLHGLAPGAIHASSSILSVAFSEQLAEAHARAGQRYVASPVFGRPEIAAAGKVWVVAAGADADVQRCRPLFESFSRGLSVVGERASAANLVKLTGSFLIFSVIEALGEAFALAQKSGLDPRILSDVLQTAKLPIIETYAKLAAERAFEPPGFTLEVGLNEVSLALAAAEAVEVPLPMGHLLRHTLAEAVAQGGGELDWSALTLHAARKAGLLERAPDASRSPPRVSDLEATKPETGG